MIEDELQVDQIPDPRITGLVRQSFVILNVDHYFEPLESAARESLRLRSPLDAAISGLRSIVNSAGLPVTLVKDSVCQRQFARTLLAERIELIPAYNEASEFTAEQREAMAQDRANVKMTSFLQSEPGIRFVRNEIVFELYHSLRSAEVRTASQELLIQTLVSIWSVFESFTRDYIVTTLNKEPALALPILTSRDLKDFFGKQGIDIETITAHSFNLSNSMGDIVFSGRRLDNFSIIKKILKAMYESSDLQKSLDSTMWQLNQRRHLFVHNRGIVDATYIEQTGEIIEKGSKLAITGYDIERYLNSVRGTIVAMINVATQKTS